MGGCLSGGSNVIPFPNHGPVTIHELIAEGGFSFVFRASDSRSSTKDYAVKRLICQEEEQLTAAKHEIEIYQLFSKEDHKHILRLLDYHICPTQRSIGNEVYLLFHSYPKTLHDLVNELKAKEQTFTEKEVLQLFLQICEGVLEFHSRDPPLAVRDIKAANVLLTSDPTPQCLIMDFGSVSAARIKVSSKSDAAILQEEAETHITPSCRPVELFDIRPGLELDERTDVWGLGTLLYFMAFQNFAFHSSQGSVSLAVLSGITSFPEVGQFSSEFKEFILKMVNVNPGSRPFLPEVIKNIHQFSQRE